MMCALFGFVNAQASGYVFRVVGLSGGTLPIFVSLARSRFGLLAVLSSAQYCVASLPCHLMFCSLGGCGVHPACQIRNISCVAPPLLPGVVVSSVAHLASISIVIVDAVLCP